MPYCPKYTITDKIIRSLAAIDDARECLERATLDETWLRHTSEQALLLEAYHSTHIEGSQLTVAQSTALWSGQKIDANKDDVQEFLNYKNAFRLMIDFLESKYPLTECLLREIHKHLVSGVREDKACPGEWRIIQNCVANSVTGEIVYLPPLPSDVPNLMRELVQWINQASDLHPAILSGIAQHQFVWIHPFIDGNGRTSRILSMLLLYKNGYDFKKLFTLSEFYDKNSKNFYLALRSVENNNLDLTCWLEYFTEGLATQLSNIMKFKENAIHFSGNT